MNNFIPPEDFSDNMKEVFDILRSIRQELKEISLTYGVPIDFRFVFDPTNPLPDKMVAGAVPNTHTSVRDDSSMTHLSPMNFNQPEEIKLSPETEMIMKEIADLKDKPRPSPYINGGDEGKDRRNNRKF